MEKRKKGRPILYDGRNDKPPCPECGAPIFRYDNRHQWFLCDSCHKLIKVPRSRPNYRKKHPLPL